MTPPALRATSPRFAQGGMTLTRRKLRKTLRQDVEIDRLDVDVVDTRHGRTAAAGIDHLAHRVVVADDQHLDRAIDAVAHPAGQAKVVRGRDRPVAVAHALHPAGDREAGLQCHRFQVNSMIFWSTRRLSPALACRVLTVPSCTARSTFSIFIASTTASASPALISWPSLTATDASRPGMGDSRNFEVSGAALTGIRA